MVATTIPTPTVCALWLKSLCKLFRGLADTVIRLYLPQRWSGWQHLHPGERRKEVNYFGPFASSDSHVARLVDDDDGHAFEVPMHCFQADYAMN